MGVIEEGRLLNWNEARLHAKHVRDRGIRQFINLYRKVKDRKGEAFVWGDEIEYILVKLDHDNKRAVVMLNNIQLLSALKKKGKDASSDALGSIWMPEYGASMLESTPKRPYSSDISSFKLVEANMKFRRQQARDVLDVTNGEHCITMTILPRYGCPGFSTPSFNIDPSNTKITKSLFVPDQAITPYGRYIGAEMNTRGRSGGNVSINIPVFKDKNTPSPFIENFPNDSTGRAARDAKVDHVYADCTVFGSASSCLQATFQTRDLKQAKYLYDQLVPLCPILMALSASSPLWRGYVADVDVRWDVLSESLDDRTREEKGFEPMKTSKFIMRKAKYDTVSHYLSPENQGLNDVELVYDDVTHDLLLREGVDAILAKHIAYLFIRDPVILFEESLNQDDEVDTGHYDSIFSTNWLSLKFKAPPADSEMGWRVEFRTLEIQVTDFENAAYVIFVMLLARAIDAFNLQLAVPISKVDENMMEAKKRDSVLQSDFFFKRDLTTVSSEKDTFTRMDMNTIINGGSINSNHARCHSNDTEDFPGLLPLVNKYISSVDADDETKSSLAPYLQLISDRASGKVKTNARWMRDFVTSHPEYRQDSVVSKRINYDLVKLCADISEGRMAMVHLHQSSLPKNGRS